MNFKCLFGFHDWKDTGIRRYYDLIQLHKCERCGKIEEFTYPNVEFMNIGGQDVTVIRR